MSAAAADLWSAALRKVLLPVSGLAFGQNLMPELRFLEESQWWDAGRIAAERNERLQKLMRTASEEVPFYRQRFHQTRLSWKDFRSAEDLVKLPVSTKSALRASYPHETTRRTGFRTYEAKSSGSTGTNFRVREDSETAGIYRAFFMLSLGWTGWRMGDPHLQTGINLKRSVDRRIKDFVLRTHYVSAYDLSDESLDTALEAMDRARIRDIWGYPGSLYYLARRAALKGWNQPLRAAVTWGDNLLPHYRAAIESAFRTRVFDQYGCGEGVQVSAQCTEGSRYHINSLQVIVEIVDASGNWVAPGETGHVLLTRLHPGPMPIIRYAVGDMAVRSADQQCSCGRQLELMDSIQGRDTDVVLTPAGNRLVVHFFTGILAHFEGIDQFQVVQKQEDAIEVRVVPSNSFSTNLADRITAAFRARGLDDMRIDVEPVAEIPAARSGKRRFVISHLERQFN